MISRPCSCTRMSSKYRSIFSFNRVLFMRFPDWQPNCLRQLPNIRTKSANFEDRWYLRQWAMNVNISSDILLQQQSCHLLPELLLVGHWQISNYCCRQPTDDTESPEEAQRSTTLPNKSNSALWRQCSLTYPFIISCQAVWWGRSRYSDMLCALSLMSSSVCSTCCDVCMLYSWYVFISSRPCPFLSKYFL